MALEHDPRFDDAARTQIAQALLVVASGRMLDRIMTRSDPIVGAGIACTDEWFDPTARSFTLIFDGRGGEYWRGDVDDAKKRMQYIYDESGEPPEIFNDEVWLVYDMQARIVHHVAFHVSLESRIVAPKA